MTVMIQVSIPPSKSYTNRALLLAALAKGKTVLKNALKSDDTKYMMAALKNLGVKITKKSQTALEVTGAEGIFQKPQKPLSLGNAGTAVRFLLSALAAQNFESIITGNKRMKQRPIKDLADALKQLGAKIEYIGKNGFLPVKIKGPLTKSACTVKGNISSQFLSGLLMACPCLKQKTEINIAGALVSKPYIDMTLDAMEKFGANVKSFSYKKFIVPTKTYESRIYEIEGDASSASYFWGTAALMKEKICIENIPKKSKQADMRFLDVLKKMGCKIKKNSIGIAVKGPNFLKPLGRINLEDMPDSAMTTAVLCAFTNGVSILKGLGNLRAKECDRLHALKTELSKLGIKIIELHDGLKIYGNKNTAKKLAGRNIIINTYNDHRIAMCFGMLSLKIPHASIKNPQCVSKTYPDFWTDLKKIKRQLFVKKNIILTGMRGCGKTALGKLLAKKSHKKFIDLDSFIEKSQKMKISDIVKSSGWRYFRELENSAVRKIAKEKHIVLATGGGTLMYARNTQLLKKNSIVVYLKAPIETLKKRLKNSSERPSLTGKNFLAEMETILQKRKEKYESAADYIVESDDVTATKNLKYLLKSLNFES